MAEKNMQVKTIAAVAGAVAAALLVVAFFLPYAAAVDEYREALGAMSANPYSETLGMSNEDLADISLFEYARIYSAAGELGMGDAFAAVYVPFTVAPAVLGVLTLLFAALRKPIPSMVFSVLTVAMTLLLNWDFERMLQSRKKCFFEGRTVVQAIYQAIAGGRRLSGVFHAGVNVS